MKTPWWIYVIVGLIAGLAGIAIAGLPDGTPVSETIVVRPSTAKTTTASTTTTPITTTTSSSTTTTENSTTTQPDTTVDTSPPAAGSAAAAPPSADAAAEAVDQPLVAEADLFVVVANGAGAAGLAARTTETLRAIGYVDAVATDGTETVDATTVYFDNGLEREAARLAVDLGLAPATTAALADAPGIEGTASSGALLIAYLGRDYGS